MRKLTPNPPAVPKIEVDGQGVRFDHAQPRDSMPTSRYFSFGTRHAERMWHFDSQKWRPLPSHESPRISVNVDCVGDSQIQLLFWIGNPDEVPTERTVSAMQWTVPVSDRINDWREC